MSGDDVPHYLIVAFLFFMIGSGSSSVYHCSLSTNYRNWPPQYRSFAIGLSVSFFGLSAYIFSSIGTALFLDEKKTLVINSFLKLLAIGCFSINFIAMLFLKPISPRTDSSIEVVDAIGRDLHSPIPPIDVDEQAPLLLSEEVVDGIPDDYQEDLEDTPNLARSVASPLPDEETPLLSSHSALLNPSSHSALLDPSSHSALLDPSSSPLPIVLEDVNFFTSFDAYLLAYICFVLAGTGLMYINNVGTIILSLFPPNVDASDSKVQILQKHHVQLLSLGSFGARIVFGALSDVCFSVWAWKKSVWAIVCCTCMLMGVSIVAEMVPGLDLDLNTLYIATMLIAIAYGGTFTVLPILVGQYFGLRNFSRNWYVHLLTLEFVTLYLGVG